MSFDIDSGLSYCPWNGRGNGKEKEKDKGTPLIPPLLLIANLLWDLNTALFTNSCASVLGHDLRVPKLGTSITTRLFVKGCICSKNSEAPLL
jgi:hypothetical protein